MISRIVVTLSMLLLMSCGGGGGSDGNSPEGPAVSGTVSLSGPAEVWSDEISWTLTASAEGLDRISVSYQLDADGSGLTMDSTTGLIQGAAITAGVYDLVVSASDGAGISASQSLSFTSNAFIAGHWRMARPSTGEEIEMVVSRNGRISLISYAPNGGISAVCNGLLEIDGDRLSGSVDCVDDELGQSTSVISGTVIEGSSITLTGFDQGDDGVFLFQSQAAEFNFGTIVPGIYVEYSDIAQGISLVEVSAEGVLTPLAPGDVGFDSKTSRCDLSGRLEEDDVFADYEFEQLKNALQVFEASISLTNCDLGSTAVDALDFNQIDAPALGASVLDTLADALSFNLYFPGNGNSNESYNAGYFRYVQFCDEANQLTAIAALLKDESEQFSIIACPVEEG